MSTPEGQGLPALLPLLPGCSSPEVEWMGCGSWSVIKDVCNPCSVKTSGTAYMRTSRAFEVFVLLGDIQFWFLEKRNALTSSDWPSFLGLGILGSAPESGAVSG